MSDFFQNGIVTTLHALGERSAIDLEAEVAQLRETVQRLCAELGVNPSAT